MTPDIRDIIILILIVLNIAQIFITRGHIPPELVDKLFAFAQDKAAATPDTNDDKLIAELRSIANALLSAQPPEQSKTVIPDTYKVTVGDPPGSTSTAISIPNGTSVTVSGGGGSTGMPPNTTISYTSPQDFDSPAIP